MQEYIYILSNPSMFGLIKIGKTTTSPDQRMSELYSTGVPTPFVLELSLQVEDCHASERAAHGALAEYRVANNREFFHVSVALAIEAILPVIGQYKIHTVQSAHGVAAIEDELARRKLETERLEKEKLLEIRRQKIEEKFRLEKRKSELNFLIAATQIKAQGLGERPVKKELSGIASLLQAAYIPLPFGFLVWLCALRIFDSEGETVGILCIVLLIAGYITNNMDKAHKREFDKLNAPFVPIDVTLRNLEKELDQVNETLFQIARELPADLPPAPAATTNSKVASVQVVANTTGWKSEINIRCNFCGESSKHDDFYLVSCPRCKRSIFTR